MKKIYPAIVHKKKDTLQLEFPDLPGCKTQGNDINELMSLAEDALGTFLALKMDSNESIPQPTDITVVSKSTKDVTTYISVDVNKYHKDTRAVKKMVSIPAWLALEAEKQNLSLSKILQEALLDKLNT